MEGKNNARGAVISPLVPPLKQCSSPHTAAEFLDNRTLELNYILGKKNQGTAEEAELKSFFSSMI